MKKETLEKAIKIREQIIKKIKSIRKRIRMFMKISFFQDFNGIEFNFSVCKTLPWQNYRLYISIGFLFWSLTFLIFKRERK